MRKTLQLVCLTLLVAGFARSASASPVVIFSAPGQYQNGGVNPCIFTGNGQDGCNQLTIPFPAFVQSTQQFTTNPLTNTYGDAPGELAQFAAGVGRDFFLGLDVNEGQAQQTLTELTITFRGATNNILGTGYQLGGTPLTVPYTQQGEGYTDYVLSAGCGGPIVAPGGVNAVCLGQLYTPFSAPAGTRSITFTFGMGTFNDGAERLFLITAGPSPVPFSDDPPGPAAVPEPTSMLLLGSGLVMVARRVRRNKA